MLSSVILCALQMMQGIPSRWMMLVCGGGGAGAGSVSVGRRVSAMTKRRGGGVGARFRGGAMAIQLAQSVLLPAHLPRLS